MQQRVESFTQKARTHESPARRKTPGGVKAAYLIVKSWGLFSSPLHVNHHGFSPVTFVLHRVWESCRVTMGMQGLSSSAMSEQAVLRNRMLSQMQLAR